MKRMNKTKTILALALVALLLTCAVGGTVAYLVTQTGSVTNTFTPAKVTCKVAETFNNNLKENVKIQNTGTTDAWIRATVVGNWVVGTGADKKIVAPWTDDIAYNAGEDSPWTKGNDGYYYYNRIVSSQGYTANLFDSYKQKTSPVEGAHLELTIVCQAVQSNLGTSAQAAFKAAQVQPTKPTTAGN